MLVLSTGLVRAQEPQTIDLAEQPTPSNPPAGKRRIFIDSATGQLSVRTPAGATVSLEAGGDGGVSTTAPNAIAGVTTFGGAYGEANTVSFNSDDNCIEFEGTTADAFEMKICADNNTDADNTLILRGHSFGLGVTAGAGDVALGTNINMELAGRMIQYTVTDLAQFGVSSTQTNQAWFVGVPASNTAYVSEVADRTFNFAIPTQANPTLVVTSANQSVNERIGMRHNQTQGQIVDLANTATSTRPIGLHPGGDVASAATITPTGNVFLVTGTTGITSVTAMAKGTCITLVFAGALTVTDGSNLKLSGDFVTSADDTLTLCSIGADWHETARSLN